MKYKANFVVLKNALEQDFNDYYIRGNRVVKPRAVRKELIERFNLNQKDYLTEEQEKLLNERIRKVATTVKAGTIIINDDMIKVVPNYNPFTHLLRLYLNKFGWY